MDHSLLNSLSGGQSTVSEAQSVLDHKLPHFFSARATQHQKSIIRGRHPVSIPKDSELWHYSKVSDERREKIMRGNNFWEVVNGSSWEEHAAKVLNDRKTKRVAQRHVRHTPHQPKPQPAADESESEKRLLRGSLQAQLKAAMAAQSDINLKVDFNKKGTINFGMTFIIVNVANEALYVDKMGELRTKPIADIQPTDRLKFKMVDLSNPSNPRAVKFGQNMWLQCLDPAENAENSLQAGSVLTTKLFGPPELESIQFADSYSKLILNDSNGGAPTAHQKSMQSLSQFQDKLQAKKRRTSIASIDSAQFDQGLGQGNENEEEVDGDDDDGDDEGVVEGERHAESLVAQSKDDGGAAELNTKPEELEQPPPAKQRIPTLESTHKRRFEDGKYAASLCGHVTINRILEMRKDATAHEGFMSDEKALRYNSKQSMHLGKWSIQPARREDTLQSFFDDDEDNGNGGGNPNADLMKQFVSSLTPIVIQQDHYCLSTAPSTEYHRWPPNSSIIVRNSQLIHGDLAEEYEKRYAKALINNINADHPTQTNTTLVTNHKHFENKKKLYFMTNLPFEKPISINRGPSRANRPASSEATSSSVLTEHQYGCVRKIVHRSAPYDFTVDRRCVWRICLFEQFAESYVALTNKEKQVQKVMETATMALKLSKMNREGARKHISTSQLTVTHRHPLEAEDSLGSLDGGGSMMGSQAQSTASFVSELPPLLGGESFSRTIREITFKTSQFVEDVHLQDRRGKEARLTEYFAEKIQDVLEGENDEDEHGHGHGHGHHSLGRRHSVLSSTSSVGSFATHNSHVSGEKDKDKDKDKDQQSFKFMTEEDGDAAQLDGWDNDDVSVGNHSFHAPKSTDVVRSLLLNNSKNVAEFRDLSAGEQLLSMHKTFGHLNRAALNSLSSSRRKSTFARPKAISASVLKKMEMLKQQDELIDTIITCKERLRRRGDEDIVKGNLEDD